MRAIRTETAPAPVQGAPYSQAIAASPGEMVWVSGQTPLDPATNALVDGDISAQTEQVITNVEAILVAAGSGLGHVVKTTVFLIDMADFGAMNAVYAARFGTHAPARATVAVAGLPLGAQVEIEAVAVIP